VNTPTSKAPTSKAPTSNSAAAHIPTSWYNILADLDFELPPDIPVESAGGESLDPQVPLSLVRQEMSRKTWLSIPEPVLEQYEQWRPTPLRRARNLERALGTRSKIFYKYEGGNLSGSHKLNTALAQAYYYKAAGAHTLVVATGAGQWGTAAAAACAIFGLKCEAFMVRASMLGKPHRATMMEMLGATVTASPSQGTRVGRKFLGEGLEGGTLSIALAEALERATEPGVRYCAGSGETYSLLHQTVIGLEAERQLADQDERADVVVAGLGAGSNFGGLAFPFLRETLTGGDGPRCVSVEPTACPKLTRGRYAYDFTDSSERTPLQKMYTLGHRFVPPPMHAGGLRYHGTAKVVSALYDRGLIEARAYKQRDVFESAVLFARCEGIVPAPESAHSVHGAIVEAAQADQDGRPRTILLSLSGHGLFDMGAYRSYLTGEMDDDATPGDEAIERSLAQLPPQPAAALVGRGGVSP
jgi:tryptophan synthase beta chain